MADLTTLANIGKEPIPGSNPAGESIQFDADYEALRTEVQKLDSVTQEPVSWQMVVDTGSDLLSKRGKNLIVACYVTVGLFEQHDYAGLATGLSICRDMLTTYWDTLEPPLKRKRGRIEAINWLAERGGKVAEARKPVTDEKEPLENSARLLKEIGAFLLEKLDSEAPGFGELERVLGQHIKDFEAAARAAEAARKAAAARAAAGEVDELNTPEDARKVLGRLRVTTKQVCDFLRKTDSADPVPYRLIRAITWGPQKELPPNTNGATQIPPPAPDVAARLADLAGKKEWANLVENAENAFGPAIFWLDLHRWSVQGLLGLGTTHEPAADAVMIELANLMVRLPELANLKFANGTPIASNETQMWIESDVKARLAGQPADNAAGGGRDDGPEGLKDTTKDARRMAGSGRLQEAIKMMQEGIARTGDQRGQFLWRLGLAKLCLDSGQPLLATPQLEDLERLIEVYNLESWEPDLCLSVYSSLLTARRILLKDQRRATPELLQKTNGLHDRLCRLDAAAALALDGK